MTEPNPNTEAAGGPVNFGELGDFNMDEAKTPQPSPAGTYLVQVGNRTDGESEQKKTPFFEYDLTVIDAKSETFDAAELAETGGVEALQGRTLHSGRFYISQKALFGIKNFLEQGFGFSLAGLSWGQTYTEILPQADGRQVWVKMIAAPMTDKNNQPMLDDEGKVRTRLEPAFKGGWAIAQ